jgi:AraC family transcriptional regulator
MAMSSLSAAPSSHTLFDARAHKPRRPTNLRLIDCHFEFPATRVEDHRAAFAQKARIEAPAAAVEITPANSVKRRALSWAGMTAEVVQATSSERISYRAHAQVHMLVLCERGARKDGETSIEGLPSSTLRDVTRKFSFVPAGHDYYDWHDPRTPARMAFFYFAPEALPLAAVNGGAKQVPTPRLFFEDAALLATAQKLMALIEGPQTDDCSYLQALGAVLAHELVRIDQDGSSGKAAIRGGLAAWQQRVVTSYIDEHLAEPVPLAKLGELAGLSTYHFCRAFKQSFGVPPHRYHTSQRIELAKTLLAKPSFSVTDIGITVGFSETSSFTAAFRKATGLTPTAYHRSLA